jgi:Fic family protein
MLHFWLAYDHPFVDGNGRTARALFYWSMLRSGYWLFEYVSISEVILRAPVKYGRAFLLTETDDNDLTYFLLYHLGVIRESLDTLKRFIAKRADDLRGIDSILRLAADRFNHRQRELLSHALRHPNQVYTIAGHQTRQGVVYQTARTDLLGLAEHGLLIKGESGKKLVFRPAPQLERLLRRLGEAASSR